ncbi:MAG: hypothetical protein NTNFB02_30790 [Nitrospira sp.]
MEASNMPFSKWDPNAPAATASPAARLPRNKNGAGRDPEIMDIIPFFSYKTQDTITGRYVPTCRSNAHAAC